MKSPILTKHWYTAATVFVDQFSRLSFVYLQYSTTGEETVKAKRAFEAFAGSHGVTIRHYHADNGRFADNLFRQDCEKQYQTQSFCGVNAHWQNGIAERHIRAHQETARTMLMHAKRRWPKAVETYLWPYALRMASDISRYTPRFDGKVPMHLFTGTEISPPKYHFHPFACPVYVLDSNLQQGKGYSKRKWTERARVGLYLGPSPQHSRSVHLVLNLETGLVSPQFHVAFDDHFETTRRGASSLLPASRWQEKAHFVASKEKEQKEGSKDREPLRETIERLATRIDVSTVSRTTQSRRQNQQQSPSSQPPTTETAEPPPQSEQRQHPIQPESTPTQVRQTRSGRVSKPPQRLIEVFDATLTCHDDELSNFVDDEHPLLDAFAASADPETMYLHEAL
jgi:hypothetical protein